jgi:hypothetical protein
LPVSVRKLADANYAFFKRDPRHPSLQFKKVGRYWSIRVRLRYRALAIDVDGGYLWFWIGSHADYDKLINSQGWTSVIRRQCTPVKEPISAWQHLSS